MILWIYFPVLAIFFAYMTKYGTYYHVPTQLFKFFLVMWLSWLVAFGGAGMTDQVHYNDFFQSLNRNSFSGENVFWKLLFGSFINDRRENYEVGYVLINLLAKQLGISYLAFMFSISIITHTLLINFIYKHRYPVFTVLIYIASTFYVQQANLVRQMIAMTIFLYSFRYIERGLFLPYLGGILIAVAFHMSAVLLFVVYFLPSKVPKSWLLWGIWLFSIYISLKGLDLPVVKIGYYSLQKFNRAVEESGPNLFFNGMLVALLASNPNKLATRRYVLAFNMFFIGVILLNLSSITFYFYRLSYYFSIFSIVVIPLIPLTLTNRLKYIFPPKIVYAMSNFLLVAFYVNILVRRVITNPEGVIGYRLHDFMELFNQ